MHGRHAAAVVVGLAVGAFGAIGHAHFDGTLDALANSLSTWLLAPFVVGTFAATRRGAAVAGVVTCGFELLGYYVVVYTEEFATTASLVAFWALAALVGGPLFGMAGQLWRSAPSRLRGLGSAALAGVFVAEGLYAYVHQQHRYFTGALWIVVGVGIAALAGRGRADQLRWLGLTVPLGLAGEVVVTAVLERF